MNGNVRTEKWSAARWVAPRANHRVSIDIQIQGRRLAPMFLAAAVFVGFLLAFVWTNHQCNRVGYAISEAHKEQVRLAHDHSQFEVELGNLTALDRLEHLATRELGLVNPRPDQVRVIR